MCFLMPLVVVQSGVNCIIRQTSLGRPAQERLDPLFFAHMSAFILYTYVNV